MTKRAHKRRHEVGKFGFGGRDWCATGSQACRCHPAPIVQSDDRWHDWCHPPLRQGLSKMTSGAGFQPAGHVDLYTPLSDDLSAGITCFDVKGKTPAQVIGRLLDRGIVGSVSPYTPSCARLACSLWNTSEEVEKALKAVGEMG